MTHLIFDHDLDGATFIDYLTSLVSLRLVYLRAQTEIAWLGDWKQATRDAMYDEAWERKFRGYESFERWADTTSFVERYGACPLCSEPLAWHRNCEPEERCYAEENWNYGAAELDPTDSLVWESGHFPQPYPHVGGASILNNPDSLFLRGDGQ